MSSGFERRKTALLRELPVAFTAEFLDDGTKESQWRAFLRRSALTALGLSLADVLAELRERLWPVLCAIRPS